MEMATFYPAQYFDDPTNESVSGEKLFAVALKEQLSDNFTVFHGFEWIAQSGKQRRVKAGEIDFLICHPALGMLIVEIKGGFISLNQENRKWISTSHQGIARTISDPYVQAKKCVDGLSEKLREKLASDDYFDIYHAVCFPDCELVGDLPAHGDPRITIDCQGMNHLNEKIAEIHKFFHEEKEHRPGEKSYEEIIEALKILFAPQLQSKGSISAELRSQEIEFQRLTFHQTKVIDMVKSNRYLLVEGCAGSGKTLLAKKLAEIRKSENKQTLVLCFNELLGQELYHDLEPLGRITAGHFHDICSRITGTTINPNGDFETEYNRLVNLTLETLKNGFSKLFETPKFDSIIIDEAQDFEPLWWDIVEQLLVANGFLAVFTDANQALYGNEKGVPADRFPFTNLQLCENFRNTKCIHEDVTQFYVGTEETYCIGPWGKAPDWIEAKTVNDQWNILNKLIDILTNEEHVHQSDIIVLTPLGMGSTMFKNQSSVGSFNFVPYEKRNDYTINWSTIRRFKGLESPVVILLEFEESFKNHPRMEELLYVGMSRAKSSLFIISPEKYTEQS